jgi:hypothetical protein
MVMNLYKIKIPQQILHILKKYIDVRVDQNHTATMQDTDSLI